MPAKALAVAAALVAVPAASASIWIANGVQHATLKVNASGAAQISWTQAGARKTLLVPARGKVLPGGKLTGADVSRKAVAPALPLLVALRQTADGRLWALQSWQQTPTSPQQLQFSRWSGDPTALTLVATPSKATELLTGTATFAGKPVTGYTVTPQGKRMRIYVYLDCFACGGASGWQSMLGVAPRADGTFRVLVRPEWRGTRYRATVPGPNVGTTLAPLAEAEVATSLASP